MSRFEVYFPCHFTVIPERDSFNKYLLSNYWVVGYVLSLGIKQGTNGAYNPVHNLRAKEKLQ